MTTINQTREVLEPLVPLLEDVVRDKPEQRLGFQAAIKRLVKLINTRGTDIVYLDFVKAGNLLDSSLSRGYLVRGFPHTLGDPRRQNFVFQDLINCMFDIDGTLIDEFDPEYVRFSRSILYFYKKIKLPCPREAVEDSVSKFFSIERELRPPTLDWMADKLPSRRLSFAASLPQTRTTLIKEVQPPHRLIEIFDMVCSRIASRFPCVPYDSLMPKHGPGSVADAKSGEDKYVLPHWPSKLEGTFKEAHYAHLCEYSYHVSEDKSLHEPPAKLIAVPKTQKGPRLITSELTSHQFLQQGILRYLRQELPKVIRRTYSPRSQLPSREWALRASKEGKMATIDLSSASDRLSLWTVERAFSANYSLLKSFHATRSRYCVYRNPWSGVKTYTKLRKFSGQGSGVTFPVQSIIYACCCYAAIIFDGSMGASPRSINRSIEKASGKCRVFGDDIILPSSSVLSLYQLLEYLQLKVNVTKSHYTGRFRESCGCDAFRGHDVTPVYLRSLIIRKPSELKSWCDVSNNAAASKFYTLAYWMGDQIPVKYRKRIIHSHQEAQNGIRLDQLPTVPEVRTRFNPSIQRTELDVLLIKSVEKKSRRKSGRANLFQYFVETCDMRSDPLTHTPYSVGFTRTRSSLVERGWVTSRLG